MRRRAPLPHRVRAGVRRSDPQLAPRKAGSTFHLRGRGHIVRRQRTSNIGFDQDAHCGLSSAPIASELGADVLRRRGPEPGEAARPGAPRCSGSARRSADAGLSARRQASSSLGVVTSLREPLRVRPSAAAWRFEAEDPPSRPGDPPPTVAGPSTRTTSPAPSIEQHVSPQRRHRDVGAQQRAAYPPPPVFLVRKTTQQFSAPPRGRSPAPARAPPSRRRTALVPPTWSFSPSAPAAPQVTVDDVVPRQGVVIPVRPDRPKHRGRRWPSRPAPTVPSVRPGQRRDEVSGGRVFSVRPAQPAGSSNRLSSSQVASR